MKTKLFIISALAGVMMSASAMALDLQQARTSGMVGEGTDGYVVAVTETPAVQALVTNINAKREQEYKRISAQNGESVKVVGNLAAVQIIQGLPTGSLYQGEDGKWKKR